MNTLKNEHFSASFNEKGAELVELLNIDSKTSYLWNGNPLIWGRISPILFPIVGKLNNSIYYVDGKIFNLPQHGFARDRPFSLVEKTDTKIVFSLEYDEESLKIYPFKFELQIEYVLLKNKLTTKYRVYNKQESEIYFSIGAHPGFKCPLSENESYEDYYLEFNKTETLGLYQLSNGLINPTPTPFLKNEQRIPLSFDLFKNDALIFKNYTSDYISLKHKTGKEVFKFHFKGYPYLGIWSKPGPLVCIEPWYGVADFSGHDGNFKNKTGIQTLKPGELFSSEWAIEIN